MNRLVVRMSVVALLCVVGLTATAENRPVIEPLIPSGDIEPIATEVVGLAAAAEDRPIIEPFFSSEEIVPIAIEPDNFNNLSVDGSFEYSDTGSVRVGLKVEEGSVVDLSVGGAHTFFGGSELTYGVAGNEVDGISGLNIGFAAGNHAGTARVDLFALENTSVGYTGQGESWKLEVGAEPWKQNLNIKFKIN